MVPFNMRRSQGFSIAAHDGHMGQGCQCSGLDVHRLSRGIAPALPASGYAHYTRQVF